MVDLIIIIILAVLVSYKVTKPLVRSKQKKELIIYYTLLFFALGLVTMRAFDIKIPNPADVIVVFFGPVTKRLLKLMNIKGG
ncbi:hypothetical protein [Bacillus marinisedimentorum]|uniref:hypothetical protein n=1 Tax=Bacillus marinisedimentorum TaxID=1821260 RepID=UPI0008727050|nr:hypothetical protein [Bacillus marinisedimentorum]